MEFKVYQKELELQSRGWIPTFHDVCEARANELARLGYDDIGVQLGDHAGLDDGVRADDGGQADLLGALDRLFQDAQRQRLFHMIEHDALCACGDQRFRQNVGKAASRLQYANMTYNWAI